MNFKMRSKFAFLALLTLICDKCWWVNAVHNSSSEDCSAKMVVCNCNVNQDACFTEALSALEAKLDKLIALMNITSPPLPQPTQPQVPVSSCKEQYDRDNSSKSQEYTLKFGSQEIPVHCHMGHFGCGDGGWTPAMKIDGTKNTFHYSSNFWSDRTAHNLPGGKTGFDLQETKLPTYWNTSFSKICLGVKIGHRINFVVINKQANSLFSLIADGTFRPTSLGRNKWKSLIGSEASLQTGCNKEGFNTESHSNYAKSRIGILGNDQGDCGTCDSKIGFGNGGPTDDSNSCGNDTPNGYTSDNGAKNVKAMGYILVQ